LLHRFVGLLDRLSGWLVFMGIPGLFILSFVDSALAPLAGGPDALVILLAMKNPAMILYIILAATLGSVTGCLVLYGIGKKGGKKTLTRFKPETIMRVEGYMKKWGSWTIVAAALAPPPFPTKVVVLVAGFLHIPRAPFLGRLIRYSLIGFLAAHFGKNATQLLKGYYPTIFLTLIGLVILIVVIRNIRTTRAA
jgi:membrane protein YqaA with SNARE-associated domain